MNMLMNGLSPVGMVYNQSAENIAYDNNNSVKDKINTIDEVDSTKYIRGLYTVSGTDPSTDIQSFISTIVTGGKNCIFDVMLIRGGKFKFSGYVYDSKVYGAGIYMDFNGKCIFWKRYNSIDTFYNINMTVIS